MQFSFVVLTWNRYRFLELCLEALLSSLHDRGQCEIVVMDNGSTDSTADVLLRHQGEPNFRVITRDRNYGIEAYKDLFASARGKYVVIVDDDVLAFPKHLDQLFLDYMKSFPDFGMLALNVIQDQFTNGSKPGPESYIEITRNGKTVEWGPTGGWCTCFRRRQYQMIRPFLTRQKLGMAYPEDAAMALTLKRWLRKKSGVIREAVCFHASGPYYAKQYGHLDREIEKYKVAGLTDLQAHYEKQLE